MNRSNQFDLDAYGDPPRRKSGCSPFTLLLMVGLAAFIYVQFSGGANRRREDPAADDRPAANDRATPSGRGNVRIEKRLPRSDGDWSIEEVKTAERNTDSSGLLNENLPNASDPADTSNDPGQRAAADRTDRGDWSIEEVDSKRPDPAKPKSTKKGDWELEEVAE